MPLTPLMAPSGNTEQVALLNPPARFQRLSRPDARTRADLIKRSCRIEEVVMGQGILLRVVGDGHHLVGLCPFHHEERASFTVYPDTQSFCCFGCHAAGDVITFMCLLRQVTFTEALRILGEQQFGAPAPMRLKSAEEPENREPNGVSLSPIYRQVKQVAIPATRRAQCAHVPGNTEAAQVAAEATQEIDAQTALAQALLWITLALGMQGLARTPGVLTYLGERGISYALARRCQLGYLADDLLASLLVGHPTLERTARQMGLLNRGGHTTLLRRLIVPEMRQGQTMQLIGRTVPGMRTPMAQIKYHLVCSAGEKHLLGYGTALQRLAQRRSAQGHRIVRKYRQELQGILVLEGALDYVIATGWDLPVLPTALLSTYPSRGQLAELRDLQQHAGGVPLLLQLDGDNPGKEATAHFTRALDERELRYRVLPPLLRLPVPSPIYKDLGELGPLGLMGRAQLLASIECALAPGTSATSTEVEMAATHVANQNDSTNLSDVPEGRQGGR
ncbi:MAG TPA: CHC2 zinc finger domain-containing protein [Ktedonobacterales bacterium]|nr:CHC2 zinc finger domain-containing protein [Ktedonobacterales bacterium]